MSLTHRGPNLGRRATLVAVALASGLAFVGLSASTGVAGASNASRFAAESGRAILATSLAGARAKASCESASTTTINGVAYASLTDSAVTSGQQTLHFGGARSVVRVVAGSVYLKDNALAILDQFSVHAPQLANRWIRVPETNANYARFNSGILFGSMLSEVAPAGPLTTTGPLSLGGVRVVGVKGRPNIHLGLASGTETLYVALSGAHVPVELVASDVVSGQRATFVITYRSWGVDFHLARPPGSIDISRTKLPG